jgi:hypothetical protein
MEFLSDSDEPPSDLEGSNLAGEASTKSYRTYGAYSRSGDGHLSDLDTRNVRCCMRVSPRWCQRGDEVQDMQVKNEATDTKYILIHQHLIQVSKLNRYTPKQLPSSSNIPSHRTPFR